MGYDFSIGIQRSGNPQTDLIDPSSIDETTIEMQLDKEVLNLHLAKLPGIVKNGDSWWWNVPEGGSLDISISSPLIGIDTHASWLAVLEIYLYIQTIEPHAFLLDSQTFDSHNEGSFRDFLVTPEKGWPPPTPDEYTLEQLNRSVDALISGDRSLGLKLLRLSDKGAPIVPRLIDRLEHNLPPIVQLDIVHVLGRIGSAASEVVPQLVMLANSSKELVLKRYIYIALGEIGAAEPSGISLLINAFNDSEIFDRHYILKALLQMQQDILALPLLFESMAQANMEPPGCWASGFADLFRYINDYKTAQSELRILLQQDNPTRRLVAAIAMDALATRHPSCESLAEIAMQDDWERVRRIATTTLSRIPRTESVLRKLHACTNDPDPEVRARASWAIDFGIIQARY